MNDEVRENYWDLVDKDKVREVIEAAIRRGYARGVADERARVVAWLLARAKTQKSWTGESTVAAALRAEADRIEREKP